MKKRGFTLAEILITLGIIGVVAALTAPALVNNSRNEANAARLSVTVSNLENAFSNAIVTANVATLDQVPFWANNEDTAAFAGGLGRFMHTGGYKDQTVLQYYGDNREGDNNVIRGNGDAQSGDNGPLTINGTQMQVQAFYGNSRPIITKQGAAVFIHKFDEQRAGGDDAVAAHGGALSHQIATVAIDVNGVTGPNRFGRDIFTFYLGENGILYPIGGTDVSVFENLDNTARWDVNANNNDFRCLDGNMGNGSGCTGRLIEEGYRMNY